MSSLVEHPIGRRSFLAGLLSTAAVPSVLAAPSPYNSAYHFGLTESFRRTKEIWAANVMNEEGGWFLQKNTDLMVKWSREIPASEWLVSKGT